MALAAHPGPVPAAEQMLGLPCLRHEGGPSSAPPRRALQLREDHSAAPRGTRGRTSCAKQSCALDSISTSPGRGFSFVQAATDNAGITYAMARGDVRIAVTLACEECKRRNYQTNKSKRNNPDRISMRKYCRWCRRHTSHRETR